MAERVRITDVSPRDGLQNEPGVIPTAEKVRLVELLCATGVDEVEVSSFVSAKWVPQLGDAAEVFLAAAPGKPEGLCFSALVPNDKGLDSLLGVNATAGTQVIDKASLFTAASETFCRRNINATINESLERFVPVVKRLPRGVSARGYVSCAIACPFEGPIDPRQVATIAFVLYDLGVPEIDLGDTIGAGDASSVRKLLSAVQEKFAGEEATPLLTLHLHDTFGRAAECVKVALDMGVRSFDGAVAGLGGCPYASTPGKRAPGNISTELLVRTVEAAGFKTGVNQAKLREAGAFAAEIVSKTRSALSDQR